MDKESRIQEAYNRVVEYMSMCGNGFQVYGLESDETYIDVDIVMDVVDKLNENGYQANYRAGIPHYSYTALEIFKPIEEEEEPMVELISADEANSLAVNHINVDKIVDDFLKMANESITDYAKNGRYFVKLALTEATNNVVYERIKKALTDKGYEVSYDFPFIKIEWAKRRSRHVS